MGSSVRSVMVVDDDAFIVRYLKEIFSYLKVPELHTATDGMEALQRYEELAGQLDAIVVDLLLPNLDGLSFLRSLAERHYSGSVVILTGLDRRILNSALEIAQSHNLNLAGYLIKPLDPLQVELVYQHMGKVKNPERKQPALMDRHELLEAMQGRSVEPYFQPIVDYQGPGVFAMESLMRIAEPGTHVREPATFLPVAEDNGLMSALTDSMLDKTLARYRDLLGEGHRFRLTINLSPMLVHELELPDRLADKLAAFDIKPEQLLIEVTEHSVMTPDPVILEVLSRLRIKGFDLALDDFGTGFSSISLLKDLPFNVIKVDRSFVHGIARDEVATMIVRSVLELAGELGFLAIVEGVERQEDLELVRNLGGQYLQGYLLCRPKPFSELRSWLGANQSTSFDHMIQHSG